MHTHCTHTRTHTQWLQAERKKHWEEAHQALSAAAVADLAKFDKDAKKGVAHTRPPSPRLHLPEVTFVDTTNNPAIVINDMGWKLGHLEYMEKVLGNEKNVVCYATAARKFGSAIDAYVCVFTPCPAAIPDEKERERKRSDLEVRLNLLKDAAKDLDDPGTSCGMLYNAHRALQV